MLTMPAPWLGFKYSYIQQCSKVRVLLYGLAPKGFGMRNMMPEESYNLQAIDIYECQNHVYMGRIRKKYK